MANNEKNENKNVGTQEQEQQVQQQNNAPEQPAPVAQATVQVVEQKNGFGAWLKKHWKGLTAGVLGPGGLVTSAFVAYKKGKAAGMAQTPMPVEQEDYSLNPNE